MSGLDSTQTARRQGCSLRRKEFREDGVPSQSMAESEAGAGIGGLHGQHLGVDSPAEAIDHSGFVLAAYVRQQAPVEASAEQRRGHEKVPGARGCSQSSPNGLRERSGDDQARRAVEGPAVGCLLQLVGLDHPCQQLLDEKRQSIGPRHDHLGKLAGNDRSPQAARGHQHDFLVTQPRELHDGCGAPGGKAVDARQSPAGLLAAKRDQAEDGFLRDVVGQVLDDLDRLGVRPLQILEHEHAASAFAQGGEQPEHGFTQDHERLLPG
jgi:hypothetical protein